MKKLYCIFLFSFFFLNALQAQVYYVVKHLNTQTIAARSVKVDTITHNFFHPMGLSCDADAVYSPAQGAGFRFAFSLPVNYIRLKLTGTYHTDTVSAYVNGVHHQFAPAEISAYPLPHCSSLNPIMLHIISSSGDLTAPQLAYYAESVINIQSKTAIDSFIILHNNASGSDMQFSFGFDTSCFIHKPFQDTLLCQGDSLKLRCRTTSRFNSNNIFTAQLSDASGSFANPTNIGNLAADLEDTIRCLIPKNISAGNGYRIRIVASSPADTSDDNGIDIRIKSSPTAPNASGNSPLCEGATLNLSSLSTTMGVSYNWNGPGGYTSNLATTSRSNVTAAMSGDYISTVTLNGCSAKDTVHVTVHPTPATPTAGSNTPVCAGGDIKLTASTVPGATYEWTGPGSYFAGIQNPTRTGVALIDGGTYSVLARVNGCPSAYSSTVVNVTAGPTVGLYPNPGDSICPGWDLTLVALPSGGGPSPSYEWFKNGSSTGAATPTYKATGVNDGDSFFVRLTAGTVCNTPVSSKPMRITVLPIHTPPTISISANPGAHVWPGVEVVFKATTGNAGAHPGYQWQRNGQDITVDGKDSIYKSQQLKTGDTICCIVTSNHLCALPREVMSNCLVMNVDLGVESGKESRSFGRGEVYIYPNPITDKLIIEKAETGTTLQIFDIVGRQVYSGIISSAKQEVDLSHLSKGNYILQIISGEGDKLVRKVVKE